MRHQKVHERPKLHQVVLQRCASQQKTAAGIKAEQSLPALRLKVLDMMRLVENHVLPLFTLEYCCVLHAIEK